jgi:hypothetical protein
MVSSVLGRWNTQERKDETHVLLLEGSTETSLLPLGTSSSSSLLDVSWLTVRALLCRLVKKKPSDTLAKTGTIDRRHSFCAKQNVRSTLSATSRARPRFPRRLCWLKRVLHSLFVKPVPQFPELFVLSQVVPIPIHRRRPVARFFPYSLVKLGKRIPRDEVCKSSVLLITIEPRLLFGQKDL